MFLLITLARVCLFLPAFVFVFGDLVNKCGEVFLVLWLDVVVLGTNAGRCSWFCSWIWRFDKQTREDGLRD